KKALSPKTGNRLGHIGSPVNTPQTFAFRFNNLVVLIPPDLCLLLEIYSYNFDYNRRSEFIGGPSLAGLNASDPLLFGQVFLRYNPDVEPQLVLVWPAVGEPSGPMKSRRPSGEWPNPRRNRRPARISSFPVSFTWTDYTTLSPRRFVE